MLLAKEFIGFLSRQLVARLTPRVIETSNPQAASATIAEIIEQELAVEDKLNDEVRDLLSQYEDHMREQGVSYQEMFRRIKNTLVTQRKVIRASGRDTGVRFADLDGDGEQDLIFSNEKEYGICLFEKDKGWTRKIMAGKRGDPNALPPIAVKGTNNGAFVRNRHIYWQNENTDKLPALIDRRDTWSGNPDLGRMTNQPHREFVYRMAYEMGRHVIGYEVQKVLSIVDWIASADSAPPIGVLGYGEGGIVALDAAACARANLAASRPVLRSVPFASASPQAAIARCGSLCNACENAVAAASPLYEYSSVSPRSNAA